MLTVEHTVLSADLRNLVREYKRTVESHTLLSPRLDHCHWYNTVSDVSRQ